MDQQTSVGDAGNPFDRVFAGYKAARAAEQAAEGAHPGGHAIDAYSTSGVSPPKLAAIKPIVDRVRRVDHWVKASDGPKHRCKPLTDALLKNHASGEGVPVGACPIERGSSTTRIALLDLDSHKGESSWQEMAEAARKLMAAAAMVDIVFVPFRSSGGRGIHLYVIWSEPQDARSVRELLADLLAACGFTNGTSGVANRQVEIFPKQDSIPADGWGNMFVLPGSGQSAALAPDTLDEIDWKDVEWSESLAVPVVAKPVFEASTVGDTPELATVREALDQLDPNDFGYDEWVRILFAVHAGTDASEDGRALMHEWSSKFSRYTSEETDKQWNAAKIKPGGIGIGSLFKLANEATGWRPPDRRTSAEGFDVFAADPVYVAAETKRLSDVLAAGTQTEEDARSFLALPAAAQTEVLDTLDLALTDEQMAATRAAIERAKAKGQDLPVAMLGVDFDMNDAGNVSLLVHLQNGNMRYDTAAEQFMFWRNGRWERDEHGTLLREATKGIERYWTLKAQHTRSQVGAAARREAAAGVKSTGGRARMDGLVPGGAAAALADRAAKQASWAKACGNLKQINAVGTLAARDARVVIDAKLLDRNPHLLGVANGVVDLRTGELRADARDEFVTRRTRVAFNPNGKAPRWEQFQQEIAGLPLGRAEDGSHPYTPRPGLVAFKRRWAGSMLIGENVGQKFYTATGEGSNGKSLEVETYAEIMGPLAVKLPQGAFIAGRRGPRDADAASPTLVALRGVRMAHASETEDGAVLDTGDVKAVTGDAEIMARGLHQNATRFQLEATPVLLTNHPPTIKTVDNAITGRVAIVPYERTWNRPDDVGYDPERPDADTGLKAALREESEGILAWMVRGAVEVLGAGGKLNPPPEVTGKTEQYLQDQSVFGVWFAGLERCDHSEGTKSAELLDDLRRHAQSLGRTAGREGANEQRFGRALVAAADRESLERDREHRWPLRPKSSGL